MIRITNESILLRNGLPESLKQAPGFDSPGRELTMTYEILKAHDGSRDPEHLAIRFDSLISHDITYVGIIQTAMASGLKEFPVPYVLTNCHNSLCAVGGTINEDDHLFGLSAAQKFGGIYVPANQAVIHQYAREEMAAVGAMILGSDSHTRYGALGTMGVGEGGPELVKQLLGSRWESTRPSVVLVWLTGALRKGVGPHDVAIAMAGAVYKNNFAKNKILEFAGPGIAGLAMDYRLGIDVMTTETACLSSIWQTDGVVEDYYKTHGRPDAYRKMMPKDGAVYDGLIEIDLTQVEPMAALPFHPSEAVTLRELMADPDTILRQVEESVEKQFGGSLHLVLRDKIKDGKLRVDQGIIAGCAGGMFDNITEASAILGSEGTGDGEFSLSVYPSSVPVNLELIRSGAVENLMEAGALLKPSFCGPCFGAGDVPANNGLSIRHTTRNFSSREGSRPGDGQLAGVILMDARSIAATARNHGVLSSALDLDYEIPADYQQGYDPSSYKKRVYQGFGHPKPEVILQFGPNIAPWPKIPPLADHILVRLAAVLHDPVTTTDELIPSGETSSYRSNPIKLASFTLSRREPNYVPRAQSVQAMETARRNGETSQEIASVLNRLQMDPSILTDTQIGSGLFAESPGDGSAREQAASCQRVLGGSINICRNFATKRYRSNCINWGILPFTIAPQTAFDYEPGDWLYISDIRSQIQAGKESVMAKIVTSTGVNDIELLLENFAEQDRELVLAGCLMNWYANKNKDTKELNG